MVWGRSRSAPIATMLFVSPDQSAPGTDKGATRDAGGFSGFGNSLDAVAKTRYVHHGAVVDWYGGRFQLEVKPH